MVQNIMLYTVTCFCYVSKLRFKYFCTSNTQANNGTGSSKKETVYMMELPDVFTSYDQTKEWITQQLNSLQVCQQEVLTCQEVNTQMTMLFLIVYINNIRSNVFEVSFSMSVALA